jgi:anti-sigma regulatory factor (Ser/Thr protein kinase)
VALTGVTPSARYGCCEMWVTIPASFDAIEKVFAQFRRCCGCRLTQEDRFVAELLLREAFTNAVVHGSSADSAKSVRGTVRLKASRLIIHVADEGEGFDWRRAQTLKADACDCSGRGLEIFHIYATRVRFNKKGNAITLTKDVS